MQVCACQLSLERITLLLARSPLFLLLLLLALLLLFLVAVVAVAADDHIAAISAALVAAVAAMAFRSPFEALLVRRSAPDLVFLRSPAACGPTRHRACAK